jgi:hypothetical protein
MALNNDHFKFTTSGDLLPVYQSDQDLGLLDPSFDSQFADPSAFLVPPVYQSYVPTTSTTVAQPEASSTDEDWINLQCEPFMDQCEQPMPFLKPDPPTQVVSHASNHESVELDYASTQVVSHASNHESVELDYALALNPEPTPLPNVQQYSYYYPQNPHLSVYHQPISYGQPQSPFKAKRHRVVEDDDDIFEYGTVRAYPTAQEYSTVPDYEAETEDFGEEDDPTGGFKLPASKSPIMEAMVVCAMNGWGIEIITNNRATSTKPAEVVFRVTDFNHYYKISRTICSKQRPTDDLGSRIKSLRRWFVNFPKKKDRIENSFNLIVKPAIAKKVSEIIERNQKTLGLTKRSRRQ